MADYIVTYQRREQYDCQGNCGVKTVAKAFDGSTTLEEVAKWIKDTAGVFCNQPNVIDNPKIIGIGDDN